MHVAGKNNTYQVVDQCQNNDGTQKWFLLECVDFFENDDLGDNIMCSQLGQKIWVANYHFQHMPILDNMCKNSG